MVGARSAPTINSEEPEYLLIDQYRIYVEHYIKTAANQWLLSEYNDPESVLSFNTFSFQLQIADLYEDIEITDSEGSV
ncbi:Uma2 family endonuclease [Trichothermofontia sichuanensis B231]|uniref:Uma2 family endonuclease n=1 Tax=Trichothermofontia sichuanensis TaxID=3045816 RepID=UPI0022472158|nr:Uma2 family endonuclease [Trichothermofontia sichuanensis B231]